MVKDKSWLKQEILDIFWQTEIDDNLNIQDANLIFDKVENAINQLDEPEKVVIPQFVANWIENEDVDDFTAYEIFDFLKHEEYQDEIHKWVYGNDDETNREREIAVLMALRYGYKVEKEKKYRVVLPFTVWDGHASEMKESTMFLALDITSGETRFPHSPASIGDYRTDLTESQIKGIDKRYWAFAEEVTE